MKPFSLPTTLHFGVPLVNGWLIFAAILPAFTMADPVLPPPPNLAEAKADPIHHLVELATRTRNKPHDLLRDADGCYPSERVVFRDSNTGCELWRMSRNPGYNRHHYASYPIWNADGTKLIVRSQRPGDDTWWLINADGGRWTGAGKNFTCWHATDPNNFFTTDQPRHGAEGSESTISETDLATGQSRVLWRLPAENIEMPPPSPDGRKLLVVQKGGEADGKPRTFALPEARECRHHR